MDYGEGTILFSPVKMTLNDFCGLSMPLIPQPMNWLKKIRVVFTAEILVYFSQFYLKVKALNVAALKERSGLYEKKTQAFTTTLETFR